MPCNRVRFPEELYDDPHVAANNLMLNLNHPVLGSLRMPACPIRMSETPAGSDVPPPVLGADGPQVLRELGYGDADIDRLFKDGVLHTRETLMDEAGE